MKECLIVTFAKVASAAEAYRSGSKLPARAILLIVTIILAPTRLLNFVAILFSSLLGFGSEHTLVLIPLTYFGQRFTGSRGSVPPRPKVKAPENITTTRHTHSSFGQSCVFTLNLIIHLLGFWLFFWCNHFATHHIHPTRVTSLVLTLSADFGSKSSFILSHFPNMSEHLSEGERTEMRELFN